MSVSPRDLVLSDGDGAVVVPTGVAAQIIADAEVLAAIERRIGNEIQDGATRMEAFKLHPRFAHNRPLR